MPGFLFTTLLRAAPVAAVFGVLPVMRLFTEDDPTRSKSPRSPTPTTATLLTLLVVVGALAVVVGIVVFLGSRVRHAHAARAQGRQCATDQRDHVAVMQEGWNGVKTREDLAVAAFLAYDRDPQLLAQYPMMRDYRDPLVQATVEAMTRAGSLRTNSPPLSVRSVGASDYARAVNQFTSAVSAAQRTAERVRLARFSPDERETIRRARTMLSLALDEANSVLERRAAYQRVIADLEALNDNLGLTQHGILASIAQTPDTEATAAGPSDNRGLTLPIPSRVPR